MDGLKKEILVEQLNFKSEGQENKKNKFKENCYDISTMQLGKYLVYFKQIYCDDIQNLDMTKFGQDLMIGEGKRKLQLFKLNLETLEEKPVCGIEINIKFKND